MVWLHDQFESIAWVSQLLELGSEWILCHPKEQCLVPRRAASNSSCCMILARATMEKIDIKKLMIRSVVCHVNSHTINVLAGVGKQSNFELIYELRAWYFPELNEMNIGLITWSFSLDLGGWTRTEEVISIAARLHRENWPYCELKGCCWGFPIDSCASDFQLCFVLTIQVFRLKTLF